MRQAFDKPVLFLAFNRPDHTQRVFQAIRRRRPTQLFISADGPRSGVEGEAEKCRRVRAVVEQVDWTCELHTNFKTENLGCWEAVSGGISWFFRQVEEGIILEDDCLPSDAFFNFCAQMLERYRHDEQVLHISGYNPSVHACRNLPSSYVFSRFPFIWGWASWRRAWALYDKSFSGLDESWLHASSEFSTLLNDAAARRYLLDKFQRCRDGEIDTWDYAWFYSILQNKGLCINPAINLVQNIGFDEHGTHTRKRFWKRRQPAVSAFPGELVHPDRREPLPALERAFFHGSQKSAAGLLLRRIAPGLFYKKLPESRG